MADVAGRAVRAAVHRARRTRSRTRCVVPTSTNSRWSTSRQWVQCSPSAITLTWLSTSTGRVGVRGEPARDREALPARASCARRRARRGRSPPAPGPPHRYPAHARARYRRVPAAHRSPRGSRSTPPRAPGVASNGEGALRQRRRGEVADRDPAARRVQIRHEHDSGTTIEREGCRRPTAGGGDAGGLFQQVKGQQRLDAFGQRGARKSALLSQFSCASWLVRRGRASARRRRRSCLRACPRVNQTSRSQPTEVLALSSYLVGSPARIRQPFA